MLYECSGIFVIFNLWDLGLVWLLVLFGFEVLISISVGFVFLCGLFDYGVGCDIIFVYVVDFVVVMDVLMVVDLENGFGDMLEIVVEMICLVGVIGIVGGLIEDVMGCVDVFIYLLEVLVECICVVVEVVCLLLFLFMFIVCVENYLYGCDDLVDMICCL